MKEKLILHMKKADIEEAWISAFQNRRVGDDEIMKEILLEDKSVVNITDHDGFTALDRVVSRDNIELLKLLLSSGANPNIKDKSGSFRFISASNDDDPRIIEILIDNGADVNSRDNFEWTPLIWASTCNNFKIVKILVQANANLYLRSVDNMTCLDYAIVENNIEIADYLINQGMTFSLDKHELYKNIKQTTHDHFQDYEGYKEYRMINEQKEEE